MKNHEKVNGRLLQTNKKWSQLKNSQREWVYEQIKAEHIKYVEQNGKLPIEKKKQIIFEAVWKNVEQREIWIPYGEFVRNARKIIDRLNRKNPLFGGGDKSGGEV